MDPSHTEEFRSLLAAEKERLERELAAFARPDPKLEGDWDAVFPAAAELSSTASRASQEEQADLREEYETAIAQEHALESRLAEVNRALGRIADGAFGQCRACGLPIADERLHANPAAEYDIEHQPQE
ncbi:MAG: hypothetical protein A3B37_01415 [Candidatus Sungbacteria bacterium RIFCSPLOWO2_01_FULL_59_16]|uniref:Uncharacterized protein n=1 Tax=Candidatus Sungbacteria bacterium RIFCSPLOWO2_01_FULL_59_16 TaxID=1802280 RepID=A0A1G2LC23_9BACT|nr:MAG: hypothetical protein A3B37_01415 [Candidatus Sungbacteria bacterium RIFCSPLOWO2_01_FULL_59_16]